MLANVIEFPKVDDKNNEVYDVYQAFLQSKSRKSQRTANEYKRRIEEFFKIILDKEMKQVTIEDIQAIKNKDVEKYYVEKLLEKGNSHNSIKTKLQSVSSFYKTLIKNDLMVNPDVLKVDLKPKVRHHETMTFDELNMCYEFMKNEKEKGLEKYLLAKTLFTTGNRRSATFRMTWKDNIYRKKDPVSNKEVWIIGVEDKGGKWIEKPISDEFYNELKQLNHGQERVFSISERTFIRALERFSKVIGKHITIHSFKATGVTLGYRMTKDINLCKQYASHENIATTDIYLRAEESYVNQLSYNMSREIDDSVLFNMTHEELLELIMNNEDIKNAILMRLG